MATEKDIVTALTISNSYNNVDKNAIECSFQSLEGANATFVGICKKVPIPYLSNVTRKGVKQTVGKKTRVGYGIGKFLQERLRGVPVIMKYDHYGLGNKPNAKNRSKMMRLKREKRIVSLVGASVEREHMVFPHLH